MATTFTPNIENVLRQNNNFMVPLSSSPYQASSTWNKLGGLDSIYNKYNKANTIASRFVDQTYNVTDPYKSEGTAGEVRHVLGSSMAKDQLQNLLGDYVKPGSPLAEKLTHGLGMFKTYGEEVSDAFRIGKDTIKAGDWDKIWSGDFLTHPLEDIRANKIGLSIPYGSTEEERLSYVPSLQHKNPFEDTRAAGLKYQQQRFKQQQLMNQRKQEGVFKRIKEKQLADAAAKAKADAAAKAKADAAAASKAKWQEDYSNWRSPSGRDHKSTAGIGSKESKKGPAGGSIGASRFRANGGLMMADGGLINFYRYGGFI